MELIATFKRNRAIKSYIKKLPSLLAKDYGKANGYNPKQVKRTIERYDLNVIYACYGIAMFCRRDSFDKYHQEIGESRNYDDMRCEIGDKYFGGNADFGIVDVGLPSSGNGSVPEGSGYSDAGDGGDSS